LPAAKASRAAISANGLASITLLEIMGLILADRDRMAGSYDMLVAAMADPDGQGECGHAGADA